MSGDSKPCPLCHEHGATTAETLLECVNPACRVITFGDHELLPTGQTVVVMIVADEEPGAHLAGSMSLRVLGQMLNAEVRANLEMLGQLEGMYELKLQVRLALTAMETAFNDVGGLTALPPGCLQPVQALAAAVGWEAAGP